jgi:predicted nuclease of predicted toxin-antitoxin system
MDVHVKRAITTGLRQRSIDVLTAQEDERSRASDEQLLDRAAELGRVLFTQDDDFLAEAKRRQSEGTPFDGVVYAHQLAITIGECIRDLELISHAVQPPELKNQVLYLPL